MLHYLYRLLTSCTAYLTQPWITLRLLLRPTLWHLCFIAFIALPCATINTVSAQGDPTLPPCPDQPFNPDINTLTSAYYAQCYHCIADLSPPTPTPTATRLPTIALPTIEITVEPTAELTATPTDTPTATFFYHQFDSPYVLTDTSTSGYQYVALINHYADAQVVGFYISASDSRSCESCGSDGGANLTLGTQLIPDTVFYPYGSGMPVVDKRIGYVTNTAYFGHTTQLGSRYCVVVDTTIDNDASYDFCSTLPNFNLWVGNDRGIRYIHQNNIVLPLESFAIVFAVSSRSSSVAYGSITIDGLIMYGDPMSNTQSPPDPTPTPTPGTTLISDNVDCSTWPIDQSANYAGFIDIDIDVELSDYTCVRIIPEIDFDVPDIIPIVDDRVTITNIDLCYAVVQTPSIHLAGVNISILYFIYAVVLGYFLGVLVRL